MKFGVWKGSGVERMIGEGICWFGKVLSEC
jgi:hypothetical protein